MQVSLKLPLFGTNMEEATMVRWRCKPEESSRKEGAAYEIETEKVTTEVQAPCDGKLLEIVASAEQMVSVGEVVCHIET